jgi:hypothetical protein
VDETEPYIFFYADQQHKFFLFPGETKSQTDFFSLCDFFRRKKTGGLAWTQVPKIRSSFFFLPLPKQQNLPRTLHRSHKDWCRRTRNKAEIATARVT